jgi:hypothetical protein
MEITKRLYFGTVTLLFFLMAIPRSARAQTAGARKELSSLGKNVLWKFAFSGDSRNCGDVVMPAIAAGVAKDHAAFYWHLGDLRRITDVDEDIAHQPEHPATPLRKPEYEKMAWVDFIQSQIVSFGKVPFYLGIGNHETIPPKTREEFRSTFAKWLDKPELRAQRLRDDPKALEPKTYYRWIVRGVDFINLDNATVDQFDGEQMQWLESALKSDAADAKVRSVVVGMHEAMPGSLAENHSMAESSPQGVENGRRAYKDLLEFHNSAQKHVDILASHSHYFMAGIFNTGYWRENGGVLPGWIVGTAGAVRYALPPGWEAASAAETNVYGYMIGSVHADGSIGYAFHRLSEEDIPGSVTEKYTPAFVHWCFAENSEAR